MEVDLDQILVAYGQQTVALEVVGDVFVDGVLREVVALDEKLGVKFELQHDGFLSFLRFDGFVIPIITNFELNGKGRPRSRRIGRLTA